MMVNRMKECILHMKRGKFFFGSSLLTKNFALPILDKLINHHNISLSLVYDCSSAERERERETRYTHIENALLRERTREQRHAETERGLKKCPRLCVQR